ncbi:carboxylating nicotinate-nucleotide diphosphorylase, partial [Streptomyces nigrescens]
MSSTPDDLPLLQIGGPAGSDGPSGGCGDAWGCGGDESAYEIDPLTCGLDPDLAALLVAAGLDPVQVEDIA